MGAHPLHFRHIMAMAVCVAAIALPAAGQAQAPCFSSLITGTVADITPQGDIVLASGQHLGLADIALPEAEPRRGQALAFLQNLKGQPTTIDFSSKPDRWGRSRAALAMPDGDLAELLLRNGLAIVDPGEAAALCQPDLLAAEREARARHIGLWADADNRPIAARDREALLKRVGQFTLVSGRIISVGVRSKWTYLNFGRDWKNDFSVSMRAELWARIAKGITAEALRGKNVLIRGVIRQWHSPSIELSAPENLEIN